jgi:hypothetical protein
MENQIDRRLDDDLIKPWRIGVHGRELSRKSEVINGNAWWYADFRLMETSCLAQEQVDR